MDEEVIYMNYCPSCGQKVSDGMNFCPECGQRLVAQAKEAMEEKPKDVRASTLVIDRAEPTYYSDGKGVRITPTRLIVPGRKPNEGPSVYAMANITSVKTEKVSSPRWVAILFACIGIAFVIWGASSRDMQVVIVVGAVMFVIALIAAILLKTTYKITISSASGESEPLKPTTDKNYFDKITNAINEALIKRG
jgi:predicted RNA-binding Zn-ribbon protein involved in translation (DUF1610 family)